MLIDAWRRLDDYLRDRPMPYLHWLRLIVGERIIDQHRRHVSSQSRGIRREEHLENFDETAEVSGYRLTAGDTSPSNHLFRKEIQARLKEALDALPAKDRELLKMRHIEQLRPIEIAARLGLTESRREVAAASCLDASSETDERGSSRVP